MPTPAITKQELEIAGEAASSFADSCVFLSNFASRIPLADKDLDAALKVKSGDPEFLATKKLLKDLKGHVKSAGDVLKTFEKAYIQLRGNKMKLVEYRKIVAKAALVGGALDKIAVTIEAKTKKMSKSPNLISVAAINSYCGSYHKKFGDFFRLFKRV